MRTICILQPGYLPWLGFFEQMHRADFFVYYDDVQYDKGGWRNRNRIKTPNGIQWLTVPVKLEMGTLLADVRISDSVAWGKRHIKSIQQNYSKAPYFNTYSQELFSLLQQKWDKLLDLDLALIEWLRIALGIQTQTLLSSSLAVSGRGVPRLINIIRELGGTAFYEGAAGRDYIDPGEFEQAGIKLLYQNYCHPQYPQLHGDFISHLSAIDLLFNCGPTSLEVLTQKDIA